MSEQQPLPADDEYLTAIGRAVMWFARCEWGAVWCCERLDPGYANRLVRQAAGDIAADLSRNVLAIPDTLKRSVGQKASAEFIRLVKQRNALIHAKPCTATGGEQRLFKNETWTTERVTQLSKEFEACDALLNNFLHQQLAPAPRP